MEIDLTGKFAIVCGSTQGIGRAAAFELADSGANVTLIARNIDSLNEVMKVLPSNNGQVHSILECDFTKPQQLKKKIEKRVLENPVHILVNNTGGPKGGLAVEAEPEDFLDTFNQHLICNQILVQAVVESMRDEKYGRIINIISTSVKQPIPGLGVSNTIRGAVANWAKTLAGELGQFGITVNNILPGATDTERLNSIIRTKSEKSGKSVSEITMEMINEVPVRRFADPEETAYAIAFLASDKAAYINGINLPVDGGRLGCL